MHFNYKILLMFIGIYIIPFYNIKANDNNISKDTITTFLYNYFTPLAFYEKGSMIFDNKFNNNKAIDTLAPQLEYDSEEICIIANKIYWQESKTLKMDLTNSTSNTLSQALTKVAGVNAINTGVGIGKPMIRGQFGNRVAVQQYGVKQEGQQWGTDHGLEIDIMDVQDINILKGAMTLEYGGDASGGVVLLDDALKFNTYLPKFSGQFSTIYKHNNAHAGLSTLLRGNFKHWQIETRLTYQDYGDYKVPAENFTYNGFELPIYAQTLKNTAGKELNARLGLAYQYGKVSGKFIASLYQTKNGLFTGAIGIPRAYSLAPDGNNRNIDFPQQNVQHYKLAYIHEQDNVIGNLNLEANLSYQYNHRKELSFPHAHTMPYQYEGNENLALGLDLQTLALNLKLSNTFHKLGLTANHQNNSIQGFEFLIPAYKQAQIEAFYLYKIVGKEAKFIQHIGARFAYSHLQSEAFNIKRQATGTELGYTLQNRANALDKQFFNYALAWSGKYYIQGKGVFADNTLQFNATKLYRNPTINELAANGVHHGTFRHEKGNANLKPEAGIQTNITYHIPFYKNLNLQASTFASYYTNYIYLHASGRFSSLPEGGQLYQYQQDKALLAGAELELNYQINLKNKAHTLNITQAYEYVYNQNLNTQDALPFTPPFHLRTSVDWAWKQDNKTLKIATIHQYYAAQNRVDRNEKTTPSYHLMHLQAMYTIEHKHQRIQFSLQVNNLFDTAYLNHLSRYRLLNLAEQGRNIVAAISLHF